MNRRNPARRALGAVAAYVSRHHLALLALMVALGGTSYAAVTIDSADVANNSLRSRDVRNNDLRGVDIRNGTLRAKDVGRDALDGRVIAEGRLAKVPSAVTADRAAAADRAATADSAARAATADSARVAGDAATLGGRDPSAYAASDPEAMHVVGTPGEPPFQNGWNVGSAPVSFYRDAFGVVHLQGDADSGPTDSGSTIFTLPPAYRPSNNLCFPTFRGHTPPVLGYVCVYSAADTMLPGQVRLTQTAVPKAGGVTLSGISFRP